VKAREEHLRRLVPPNDESSEIVQPGQRPLDLPAVPVATQGSSVLDWIARATPSVRHDDFDATIEHCEAKRIAVISFVGNEAARFGARTAETATRDTTRGRGLVDDLHFRLRGGVYGAPRGTPEPSTRTRHFEPLPRFVRPIRSPPIRGHEARVSQLKRFDWPSI
jgi:hypothetical protein